jgi:hypothetical protein
MTTPASMLDVALSYLAAGRSVVPISPGSKIPSFFNESTGEFQDLAWKQLQHRPLDQGRIRVLFAPTLLGIGIVCGAVSGLVRGGVRYALEVLDIDDTEELLEQFIEAANWQGLGEVLQRLLHQRTPGGAGHFAYLCSTWEGNLVLARRPRHPDEPKQPPCVTLIETRGEGGQAVVAPTPPGIHPEHPERGYQLVRGSWTDLPIITPEERQSLLTLARSFHTYVDTKQVRDRSGPLVSDANGTRPGDVLNQTADRTWWSALLEPHGWARVHTRGDIDYWRRPGKDGKVWSATLGACGQYFYVFSSNAAPFEQGRAYSPFSAYALLDHGGDFTAAAGGVRTVSRLAVSDPDRPYHQPLPGLRTKLPGLRASLRSL